MIKTRFSIILSMIITCIFTTSVFAYQYNDVPNNHWAFNVINEATESGLVNGFSDGTFGLGKTIKRSEFASMLVRMMEWENTTKSSHFSDVNSGDWYFENINILAEHNVYNDSYFRPNDNVTRLEMAVMLVKALGYDDLAKNETENKFTDVTDNFGYVSVAYNLGIINGKSENLFDPNGVAVREEAVAMLIRVYEKYNSKLNDIDGFYAISSWTQKEYAKNMDTVSFGWGRLEYSNDGTVLLNTTNSNGNVWAIPEGYADATRYMKENNVSINFAVTMTDEDDARAILLSKENRDKAILQILEVSENFDGVTIDFETMKGDELKNGFNEFIIDLKSQMNSKKLYIAVHPVLKNSNEYYNAYDYNTISKYADKIVLMIHDYAPSSVPDNLLNTEFIATPVTPFDEVYYALKAITDKNNGVADLDKIEVAMSTASSVAWKTSNEKIIDGTPIYPSVDTLLKRLAQPDTKIMYSEKYKNPYAFYNTEDNEQILIWYEDSRSISDKIILSKMFGINSISIWRLGAIPNGSVNQHMNVWDTILTFK